MTDEKSIYILQTLAQARLLPESGALPPERDLLAALTHQFGETATPTTEGDLARAALDLLAQDPSYAEPIRILSTQSSAPQKYLDASTIAVATAAILALQTHVKFKLDRGKVTIEIDKRPLSDAALKTLIDRLIAYLPHPK